MKEVIVNIENLDVSFPSSQSMFTRKKVIRGLNLKVYRGEVLALIGESGSGKSVTTSLISGLIGNGGKIDKGKVNVFDFDTTNFKNADWEWSQLRGKKVAQVFQDPKDTLNRYKKVGFQVIEALKLCKKGRMSKSEYKDEAKNHMRDAGLTEGLDRMLDSYPHELSGGQRQRVVIAIALATGAELIICDEPTTALDPVVQADVLNTFLDISQKKGVTIVFVSHDLGVVSTVADRICVMYAGKIIEEGTTAEIMFNPKHPYTWGLLMSMPDMNFGDRLRAIEGSVPSDVSNVQGDAFAPRNPYAMRIDYIYEPPFFKMSPTHKVASWLYEKKAAKIKPPIEILERWKIFNKHYKNLEGGKDAEQ